MLPVESTDVCSLAKNRRECVVAQITIDCCGCQTDRGVALPQVTLDAPDEIIRARLYDRRMIVSVHVPKSRLLLRCNCVEETDGPSTPASSRQLRRCCDGSLVRCVYERYVRSADGALRLTSNAASVEERVAVRRVLGAHSPERENIRAFDKERSPLGKEGFECREIHNRRVDFDLSEVRVECRIQSEITREAYLRIEAKSRLHFIPLVKWIIGYGGGIIVLCQHIRNELQLLHRLEIAQSREVSVAVNALLLCFRRE